MLREYLSSGSSVMWGCCHSQSMCSCIRKVSISCEGFIYCFLLVVQKLKSGQTAFSLLVYASVMMHMVLVEQRCLTRRCSHLSTATLFIHFTPHLVSFSAVLCSESLKGVLILASIIIEVAVNHFLTFI